MRRRSTVALALTVGLLVGGLIYDTPALALEKCKAVLKARDGTIEVSVKKIAGPLRWGDAMGSESVAFFNEGTCVKGDKARKCVFGALGSLERITPPAGCTVYLADGAGPPCAAYIKKCVPGLRSATASACGNGVIDAGEDCEADDLDGETCATQSFFNGELACGAGCRFDTSGCNATRFVDNGNGTVTDHLHHLMWEKKTGPTDASPSAVDPHDVDNVYTWCENVDGDAFDCDNGIQPRDGTLYTQFLPMVNGTVCPAVSPCGGLGGYNDWEVPTIEMLQTIILQPHPACTDDPCIDPVFSHTASSTYFSNTERTVEQVWSVLFSSGFVANNTTPMSNNRARAVRRLR